MYFRSSYGFSYVICRREEGDEGFRDPTLTRQQVQNDFVPPIQLRMT